MGINYIVAYEIQVNLQNVGGENWSINITADQSGAYLPCSTQELAEETGQQVAIFVDSYVKDRKLAAEDSLRANAKWERVNRGGKAYERKPEGWHGL